MKSLSFRIFLSFWLAMVLIVIAAVGITFFILHEQREYTPRSVHTFAKEAATALSRGGREGLTEWLRKRGSTFPGARVYVLTPDNRELLGRPFPRFLAGSPETGLPLVSRSAPGVRYRPLRSLPALIGPDGTAYRFLVLPRRPGPFGMLALPQVRLALLIVALVVTALVSYLLARSITRPIDDLTHATQKIADGDLQAKVSPATLGRRDELGRLGTSFDAMAGRIRELLESRERLLRDISHELRSPLARMRVALGLARQPGGDASRQLSRLEQESERLDGLIGQILAISRLGAGGGTLDFERIELGTLIDSIARDAAYEAQATRKTMTWEPPAVRVQVEGNAHWLGSAIENVVRNAVRHTPEGGNVTIELVQSGERATIRVRDQGPGVPESDLAKIFEPFYRVASARDRDSGGEGLGLAITARVMRIHGGTVQARNVPGGGLEVELVAQVKGLVSPVR